MYNVFMNIDHIPYVPNNMPPIFSHFSFYMFMSGKVELISLNYDMQILKQTKNKNRYMKSALISFFDSLI